MSDLLDKLADEAESTEGAASEDQLRRLTERADDLVRTDREIEKTEQRLKDLKNYRNDLAHRELPDMMMEMDVDSLGRPELGVDLVLSPFCRASIPASWEDERREAGFAHLTELGGGDLIKATLTVAAGRGDMDAMQSLSEQIDGMLADLRIEGSLSLGLAVNWGTLTSFVREQHEAGVPMKLDLLGATVGSVVKIKQRKE